jgi:RimJ/RimL family protein N-acetyltransferase
VAAEFIAILLFGETYAEMLFIEMCEETSSAGMYEGTGSSAAAIMAASTMVTFGGTGVADGGRTASAHVGDLHPTDFMFGFAIDVVCPASPISFKPTISTPPDLGRNVLSLLDAMVTARYFALDSLKDGTQVIVRAIRNDDRDGVLSAFSNLDRESIYTRFFTLKRELTKTELRQLTDVDNNRVVALVVALAGDERGDLVGGGRYCRTRENAAEIAFTTAERFRDRGVASLILNHLVRIAGSNGIVQFEADVLPNNIAMLSVFRKSGLKLKSKSAAGVQHIMLAL